MVADVIPEEKMAADKQERRVSRDVPKLAMRAEVVPSSIDVEKRTVDLVWTTGARVRRGFFDPYDEELSLDPKHVRMERMNAGAPLLDSHRSFETRGVIGVVESANLAKGEGRATVRFAKDSASDAIFQKVQDRILRNVSVGYRVHKLEKVEESADKVPVYRATDWEPMEVSIVPIGADAGAGVRAEGAETNPCIFVDPEERTMAKNIEDTAAEKQSTAADVSEKRSGPTDADVARAVAEATANENARIAAIQRTGAALGTPADVVARAVADAKVTADQFRADAIAAFEAAKKPIVEDGHRGSIIAGEDARDKWLRGAGDWLITRAAAAGRVSEAAKKRGEDGRIDPGEFRGMSLLDLARESLERAGTKTRGMSKTELAGAALTQRSTGYAATGDFPVLLENTLHKTLLADWSIAPDTWSRFCAVGSVSDFKAHNRYRMGSFGSLDAVPEGAEYKQKAISDGRKESIAAATKGNIIALTRQAIIDDDMSAFSRLAGQLGRAAKLSIEVDVYALLALNSGTGPTMVDGDTLFHANHNNVGAGVALSVAGLDADRQILAEQTDESGNDFLDLRPAVLLVPIGIGGDARVINDAQYDVDALDPGTDDQMRFARPNKVRGLFREIVDTPRLSGTRRYVFADPSIAPVLEVVFLDGQQAPYMEMRDGWNVDGVEWKIRLDYGVGAIDYRGAVTDAGA